MHENSHPHSCLSLLANVEVALETHALIVQFCGIRFSLIQCWFRSLKYSLVRWLIVEALCPMVRMPVSGSSSPALYPSWGHCVMP